MKILVLSDSHGLQYFMQRCVEALQPDAVIHLGDMVRDADKLAAQYPGLAVFIRWRATATAAVSRRIILKY